MSDYRGKTYSRNLQDGVLFQAFAAEDGGNHLVGNFKRISGGGNSAIGADVMIAVSNQIQFDTNGRFRANSSVGTFNSGQHTGVASTVGSNRQMSSPGTYELQRYTITLRYPTGEIARKFFAFASRQKPAQIDTSMIFIGDRTFIAK